MGTRKGRFAFSLLEVLAVVAILGIIAAIVLPSMTESSATATQRVNEHTAATLNTSISRYYVDKGKWPTALTELVPTYLPKGVPTNPVDDSPYYLDPTTYRVKGTGL